MASAGPCPRYRWCFNIAKNGRRVKGDRLGGALWKSALLRRHPENRMDCSSRLLTKFRPSAIASPRPMNIVSPGWKGLQSKKLPRPAKQHANHCLSSSPEVYKKLIVSLIDSSLSSVCQSMWTSGIAGVKYALHRGTDSWMEAHLPYL